MYICEICKEVFDEPEISGFCDERLGYEIQYFCPVCHSASVSEAVQCKSCEEYFPDDEEKDKYHVFDFTNSYNEHLEGVICNDCLSQLIEEVLSNG